MGGVDAGIDHRDQHLVALGERVRLRQAELVGRILPWTLRDGLLGRRRFAARARLLLRLLLLRGVNVVRLHILDQAVGFERANDLRHRTPVLDLPAKERGAGRQREQLDPVEPMPQRQRIDGLRRQAGRELDHDLIRHVAPLTGGRHAACGPASLSAGRTAAAGIGDAQRRRLGGAEHRRGDGADERRRADDDRNDRPFGRARPVRTISAAAIAVARDGSTTAAAAPDRGFFPVELLAAGIDDAGGAAIAAVADREVPTAAAPPEACGVGGRDANDTAAAITASASGNRASDAIRPVDE